MSKPKKTPAAKNKSAVKSKPVGKGDHV